MRYLTLRILCRFFELATRFLVRPLGADSKNREMLAWFLEWDRTQRQHWIATFSFPLFSGIHPKNVFTTRIDDLREEVASFSSHPLRVIDFGCGSGRMLELLASHVSEGLGIDLRPPTGNAHAVIQEKNPQIRFEYREHTPASLRERIHAFKPDLVLLSHVLEHIENPVDFLKAFHPFPVLVCLPSEESWVQKLRQHLGLNTSSDSTHFREYTRASVQAELEQAGYRTDRVRFNAEGELVFLAKGTNG
jgi:SAM-dependent methyltransferase